MAPQWHTALYATSVVGSWYGGHLLFSMGMKHSIDCITDIVRLTTAQVLLGALLLSAAAGLGIITPVPAWLWRQGCPQGVLFLAGTLCTNASLLLLPVSFAYLLKAVEPFFALALVWALDGKRPGPLQVLSLALAVSGLALTGAAQHAMHAKPKAHGGAPDGATQEASGGETAGIVMALVSNLMLQMRNVLNKQLLRAPPAREADAALRPSDGAELALQPKSEPSKEEHQAAQPLQVVWVSFVAAAAASLVFDALSHSALWPTAQLQALGLAAPPAGASGCLSRAVVRFWLLATPLCFVVYQVASTLVLGEVEPVMHAALNSTKRAVVIVASALLLNEPLSPQYLIGGTATLVGVSALSSANKLSSSLADRARWRRLCLLLFATQLAVAATGAHLMLAHGAAAATVSGPSHPRARSHATTRGAHLNATVRGAGAREAGRQGASQQPNRPHTPARPNRTEARANPNLSLGAAVGGVEAHHPGKGKGPAPTLGHRPPPQLARALE